MAHCEDKTVGMEARKTDWGVNDNKKTSVIAYIIPVSHSHANRSDHEALHKAMRLVDWTWPNNAYPHHFGSIILFP